jgi:cell wall-associated NlpC family hydrolase
MNALPYRVWGDLLGKPFLADGRGPDAFDCVGLLLEVQRRLGNCTVRYNSNENDLGLARTTWERVQYPEPGDGILLRSDNPKWHIGVVAGGGFMLHAFPGRGVARERYDAFPWHKRIEGFYRWKQA